MDNNAFWQFKIALAAFGAAFTAAFGWVGVLLAVWLVAMLVDYVSGSAAAMRAGEWSSRKAREGLWHKFGMVVAVGGSAAMAVVLSVSASAIPGFAVGADIVAGIFPLTLLWYILTELGSILENAHALGAPLPGFLLKALASAKGAVDKDE